MKKVLNILCKMLKWVLIALVSVIVLFLIIRFIGQKINNIMPRSGIHEEMYVEINDTKHWISIYGKNINNPVLLYLHGGPGASTSSYDYVFTRKWSDVYTIVTWDQRNCGKSYSAEYNSTKLTYDLIMSDGVEMTKFIREHLGQDKITILGHSWGTFLGSNLVLEYPEYYDCYIGTGQCVDSILNETAFKQEAEKWAGNDEDGRKLLQELEREFLSKEYLQARNGLMVKYGYDIFADGTDYNLIAAQIFNPYYSVSDFIKYINSDFIVYSDFIKSDEFNYFSLLGKEDYEVPYYNINGNKDYQTNYLIAQEYFESVNAPRKEMYIMKDTTHGLLESKSKEFSDILHEIASIEQKDIRKD